MNSIMPSDDPTGATDIAAINAALSANGTATLAAENFCINSPIFVGQFQALVGAGPGQTVVRQVSTSFNAVTVGASGGTVMRPAVTGIEFLGPSSGSGSGIGGGGAGNVIVGMTMCDVICSGFGGSGVAISAAITSSFDGVNCSSNGGAGIYLYGNSGATTPTSGTLRNCYCDSNKAWGFCIVDSNYMTLEACASDSNVTGYEIVGGYGVSLISCGSEATTGTGFKINGGTGHSLTSCLSVDNPATAFWATNSASCSFISCTELGPASGATASFKSDVGTNTVLIQPRYVTPLSLIGKHETIG